MKLSFMLFSMIGLLLDLSEGHYDYEDEEDTLPSKIVIVLTVFGGALLIMLGLATFFLFCLSSINFQFEFGSHVENQQPSVTRDKEATLPEIQFYQTEAPPSCSNAGIHEQAKIKSSHLDSDGGEVVIDSQRLKDGLRPLLQKEEVVPPHLLIESYSERTPSILRMSDENQSVVSEVGIDTRRLKDGSSERPLFHKEEVLPPHLQVESLAGRESLSTKMSDESQSVIINISSLRVNCVNLSSNYQKNASSSLRKEIELTTRG